MSHLVVTEFFDQGDKEKNELNIQPQVRREFRRRRRKHFSITQLGGGWLEFNDLLFGNPNI